MCPSFCVSHRRTSLLCGLVGREVCVPHFHAFVSPTGVPALCAVLQGETCVSLINPRRACAARVIVVNPRRACTARVTVLGSVCLCVCLSQRRIQDFQMGGSY